MTLIPDRFCKDCKLEFSSKSINNIYYMTQSENGWNRGFHKDWLE